MAADKRGAAKIDKGESALKSLATSALSRRSPNAQRNPSEVVAKAFAAASKRTGTFASKYAK